VSDPPPPSGPPAGWYPDPTGRSGYRWWDGASWTERVSGAFEVAPRAAGAGPIGEVGPWFAESFGLAVRRAGHLLPIIVVFVLALALPSAFALWTGLRDTVLTFDPDQPLPDVDYGGSLPALIIAAVLVPVSIILAVVAKAAVARQTWAAQAGDPEPWSQSVLAILDRWRPVLGAAVGRTGLYWLLNGAFLAGMLVTPVFVILFPFLVVAQVLVWLRLCFVAQAAALSGPGAGAFTVSFRLSGLQPGRLLGRLALLAFVAANLVLVAGFIGAPFTALVGAEAGPPIDPRAESLSLNDFLGANVAIFVLGSAFSALGLGANHVLASVGTTLLYRNLGGPVEEAAGAVGSPAPEEARHE